MANDPTVPETATAHDHPTAAEVQQFVKRSMEALTRLLVGKKGDPRGSQFNNQVMIIVGSQLPTVGMMWLADVARLNRKHVVHLSASQNHNLPVIALAYCRGDIVEVYENCMLCLSPSEDRVSIVPDSFANGAFQCAPDMKLKRRKAPASFDAAMGLIKRAYGRFYELRADAPAEDWEPLRFTTR